MTKVPDDAAAARTAVAIEMREGAGMMLRQWRGANEPSEHPNTNLAGMVGWRRLAECMSNCRGRGPGQWRTAPELDNPTAAI